MFLFCVSCYLEELKKYDVDIYDICLLVLECSQYDGDLVNIDVVIFECCLDNFIDYVVMEKILCVCVVLLFVGWNDVGSWLLIWDVYVKDVNGNVIKGDVLVYDSYNCLVYGNGKLVLVIGLEDIVVVEIKDVMMIVYKDWVQDVKYVVKDFDVQGCSEIQNYCEVYCLWGFYDLVDMGGCFQVKYIIVKFGVCFLLQMYYYCVEYWIVVFGIVQVICDDKIFLFIENQLIYILIVFVYCLVNFGKILLEIIEVQFGSYFGEDDIECLEDVYGCIVELVL